MEVAQHIIFEDQPGQGPGCNSLLQLHSFDEHVQKVVVEVGKLKGQVEFIIQSLELTWFSSSSLLWTRR